VGGIRLIALKVQDRIKDRAEYVQRTIVVRSVFVLAVVTVLVFAVRAVLVSALETLAKVVLILAAINVGLIARRSAAIDVRIGPTDAAASATVPAAGFKALAIAFVYGLPEQFRAAIVGVVIGTVAIYAIAAGGRVAVVIAVAARTVNDDACVSPCPVVLTLAIQLNALLRDLCLLLFDLLTLLFGPAFLYLIVIPVALSVCYFGRAEYYGETYRGQSRHSN
jgi:hypothetical protein